MLRTYLKNLMITFGCLFGFFALIGGIAFGLHTLGEATHPGVALAVMPLLSIMIIVWLWTNEDERAKKKRTTSD